MYVFVCVHVCVFRKRERVHVLGDGEGQREMERENLKQEPHTGQSPTQGLNSHPEIMT